MLFLVCYIGILTIGSAESSVFKCSNIDECSSQSDKFQCKLRHACSICFVGFGDVVQ